MDEAKQSGGVEQRVPERGRNALVFGAALAAVACRGSGRTTTPLPEIDARVAGEHCISADPLAYYFQQEPHTEAEIRRRKAFARTIEPTRFTIEGSGEVRATGIDGRPRTGTVIAAHAIQDGQSLTIRWQGEPPPPPVLSGTEVKFTWTEDGSMLLADSHGEPQFQLVGPGSPMCVEADRAWLRDPAAQPTPGPADSVAPAAWATKDPATWPQIVLTNMASFHGSSPPRSRAGCSPPRLDRHG